GELGDLRIPDWMPTVGIKVKAVGFHPSCGEVNTSKIARVMNGVATDEGEPSGFRVALRSPPHGDAPGIVKKSLPRGKQEIPSRCISGNAAPIEIQFRPVREEPSIGAKIADDVPSSDRFVVEIDRPGRSMGVKQHALERLSFADQTAKFLV